MRFWLSVIYLVKQEGIFATSQRIWARIRTPFDLLVKSPDDLAAAANRHFARNRISIAKQLAQVAVDKNPGNLAALHCLYQIAKREEDWATTRQILSNLVQHDPSNFLQRTLDLAEFLIERKEYQSALEALQRTSTDKLAAATNSKALYLLAIASSHTNHDLFLETIAQINDLDFDGTSQQMLVFSKILKKHGMQEEATRWLNRAVEASAGQGSQQYLFARQAIKLGENQLAKQMLQEVEHHQPALDSKFAIHLLFGDIHTKLNEHEAAIERFSKAIALEPQSEIATRNLVVNYQNSNQYEKAETILRDAVIRFPNELDLQILWMQNIVKNGSAQEIETIWKQTINKAGFSFVHLRKVGILLERSNMDQLALLHWKKTFEFFSKQPFSLIRILRLQDRSHSSLPEILPIHKQLMALAPDSYQGLLVISRHYLRDNQLDKAEKSFLEGIALYPEQINFSTGLLQVYMRQDNQAAIDQFFADATKLLHPDCPKHRSNMARLYCVAENYVQSDQLYDSLFLSFPEEQSARQAYVRNLMKRGLYEKALLHIRWFLEFDLDFSGLDQFEEHCTLLLDLCEQKPAILPEGILPWLLQNSPVASRQDRDGSILMVVSSLRAGGAERQVLNTLKVLKAQVDDPVNIQLLVGSLDPKKSANFYLNDILQTGVDVCEFENGDKTATCSAYEMTPEQTAIANIFAAMPADVRRFALPVYHECCANRPSVIHLWQDRLGVCGAMAAIAAGVPRIVIGARSTRPDARRRHRRYLKPIYQTLLKARPKQICLLNNSHAGADDYAKWLQLSASQIQVIHNGFDLEALGRRGSVKAGKNSRETINIPKSAFVFGSVGRFTMEKRPELWVDTAMILAKHLDTAHFLLVGDGPLLEAQAKRAKASPYSDRFHFVGIKRPVEPWMSAMDLLMLTSKREGLPNVLVEAQALEIAVATTNAGGAKEAVAANGAGLVFSSDQPDAMAQQVMEFIQDADEFAAARQRAKVWVNNAFTLKDMAKKVLSCYS